MGVDHRDGSLLLLILLYADGGLVDVRGRMILHVQLHLLLLRLALLLVLHLLDHGWLIGELAPEPGAPAAALLDGLSYLLSGRRLLLLHLLLVARAQLLR